MQEILLEAGGRWDRLRGCYADAPPQNAKIVDLNESQVEAARWLAAWLDAYRRDEAQRPRLLMLAGARRGGKTFLLTLAIVAMALEIPGAICWMVSPTLDKRDEIDRCIKSFIPSTWWKYVKAPHFRFDFVNGSHAKNISGEIPENLKRGRADVFLVNEAQMMSKGIAIGGIPAIMDTGGLALFAANPPQNRKGEWVSKLRDAILEKKINGHFLALDPSLNENIDHAARADVAKILGVLDPRAEKADHLGVWLPVGARGYFQRQWFAFVDQRPSRRKVTVRYWDLAGTSESGRGDYAAGCRMSKLQDEGDAIFRRYCVEDVCRLRGTPGDVRAKVASCASQDGREVEIWIEQDPGQAGADQIKSYQTQLAGYTVRGRRKGSRGGAKLIGAGPFSTQVQAGQVSVVRGAWTDMYISELEDFPEGVNDDCVDASSGAFAVLEGDGGWGNLAGVGGSRRI